MYSLYNVDDVNSIPEVVETLIEASKDFEHEADWSDKSFLVNYLKQLVQGDGVVLVVYNEHGMITGVMLGNSGKTNIMTPQRTVATELLWWVHKDHRNSKVGLQLFTTFQYWAEEVALADDVVMGLSYNGHDVRVEKFLERKGFSPLEKAFIRKVK